MSGLIRLENRSVIEIQGPDAHDFLQGILTNDITLAVDGTAIYAGLLMPQGKLLFDFFIVKHKGSWLVDVDAGESANLVKRLMFYKLRADVQISALDDAIVCASLAEVFEGTANSSSFIDPRIDKAGSRIIILEQESEKCTPDLDKWLAHRVALGLPEAPADYAYGNCFPHDIAMDQLNGIGFKKGCYVGQEVVSRMQHRGTARKRPMIIEANETLPAVPAKIQAEGALIGTLGSVSGDTGLAEIRLDRAIKARNDGKGFEVDGIIVTLRTPDWADYGEEFATPANEDANNE